jgi:hypothetical protein
MNSSNPGWSSFQPSEMDLDLHDSVLKNEEMDDITDFCEYTMVSSEISSANFQCAVYLQLPSTMRNY